MATIEDTSNVIDTYGILQPKLNNRWKLEFYQDNQLIEWTQILSNQAIKIHPFSEDFNMSFFGLQLPPDFLTVVFEDDITNQLTKALKSKELLRDNSAKIDLHLLEEALKTFDISSPGLILQALEKYLNGFSAENSVLQTSANSLESLMICQEVANGSWTKLSQLLKNIKKEDVYMLKCCILGYLKTIVLNNPYKALNVSRAIQVISNDSDDLPLFIANLCVACDKIVAKTIKS